MSKLGSYVTMIRAKNTSMDNAIRLYMTAPPTHPLLPHLPTRLICVKEPHPVVTLSAWLCS